jgi:hypothetical protein
MSPLEHTSPVSDNSDELSPIADSPYGDALINRVGKLSAHTHFGQSQMSNNARMAIVTALRTGASAEESAHKFFSVIWRPLARSLT